MLYLRPVVRGIVLRGFLTGLFLLVHVLSKPAVGQNLRFAGDALSVRQAVGAQSNCGYTGCPAAAFYDVVALRVAFQPDTTRYTTGDGTFDGDLFDGLMPNVDPFPHDAAYFEAHLAFLSDYVARVSNGRTQIETHLLPEVVHVSGPMAAYSPVGFEADRDDELVKLASLVQEAWTLATTQSSLDMSGFDPDRTAFIIFHAGVGRDVELIGTTLDKTPQDLPSLFFNQSSLRRLLGVSAVSFNGFPVDHTMILPRTETRKAFDYIQDQSFLLELSINGLLAASFFNYLNVPDQFDTQTGESAIGPFGLMDPLGIFAYNGLFPPEPNAWTKRFLGWGAYTVLSGAGPVEVTLQAAGGTGTSEAVIVPVSDAEYFLVENRFRDPEGDGLVMQIWKDGRIEEQRVENGDEDFNERIIDGFLGGVVVSVDHYDWALPGGVDEHDNELNGGILIWHVDERVLAESFGMNAVNADPFRRAIDLEEADSAQDIGFPSGSTFGPQSHLGSPFDFFYEGNPITVITQTGGTIRLYENRFGPNTYPNSHNNEGGMSGIVLEDFSVPAVTARFTFFRQSMEGLTLRPEFDFKVDSGTSTDAMFDQGSSILLFGDDRDKLVFHEFGQGAYYVVDEATGAVLKYNDGAFISPVVVSDSKMETYAKDVSTTFRISSFASGDPGAADVSFTVPVALQNVRLVSPPVLLGDGTRYMIFRGVDDDRNGIVRLFSDHVEEVIGIGDIGDPASIAVIEEHKLAVIGSQGAYVEGVDQRWTYSFENVSTIGQGMFGTDATGLVGVVPAISEDVLLFLRADGTVLRIDVAARMSIGRVATKLDESLNPYPVLADLDADGRLDVLSAFGTSLVAFTQGGAMVRGFPIQLSSPTVAQPLVAELSDSGSFSVLVAGFDGYLYAYDLGRRGEPVAGFPLSIGNKIQSTPLLTTGKMYAVTVDGFIRGYALDHEGEIWWGRLYGNEQNHSFVQLSSGETPTNELVKLLDKKETYNWPNPIREGWTYLRFQTNQRTRVRITIIDAAGGLIDETEIDDVRAGVPTEYLWQTGAASGLYFARIKAIGENGQTDTELIKMAIIR